MKGVINPLLSSDSEPLSWKTCSRGRKPGLKRVCRTDSGEPRRSMYLIPGATSVLKSVPGDSPCSSLVSTIYRVNTELRDLSTGGMSMFRLDIFPESLSESNILYPTVRNFARLPPIPNSALQARNSALSPDSSIPTAFVTELVCLSCSKQPSVLAM